MISLIRKRAQILSKTKDLSDAVESNKIERFQDLSTGESLIIGLINQNVRTFLGVFGHGSTDIAEIMRIYEEEGAIKVFQLRSEIEASHAASALKWQYGITSAVFTSIGPGALQALSASIVPLSNKIGIYYIFGDETTESEGPNMQQIPKQEQELFLKLAGTMSGAYSLHTPQAIFTALKRGAASVFSRLGEKPFYILMPMNVQPKITKRVNLLEFPKVLSFPPQVCGDKETIKKAVNLITSFSKICIKTGGGAKRIDSRVLKRFIALSGAVYVHGPNVPGIIPYSDNMNMGVGGSKGSICGNYAMENCELLIIIGARGVCQWDSSGTAFPNVKHIINLNTTEEDISRYNKTLAIPGDAALNIETILLQMEKQELKIAESDWQRKCFEKKQEWEIYKNKRFLSMPIFDKKFKTQLPTQPFAIKTAIDFADSINAVKFFDAGDVQANGFQITHDESPGKTFTDTGASYMGFAVSALLASAMVEKPDYPIAFTGDGSFMMNPQILIDGIEHGLRGMILLFDNRRMAAISSLQQDQYGIDYKTDDNVIVDYVKLASSISGVAGFKAPPKKEGLQETLKKAYDYQGLSLVHIPVYFGENELSGLGVFGRWNVGNRCESVQETKHYIGL